MWCAGCAVISPILSTVTCSQALKGDVHNITNMTMSAKTVNTCRHYRIPVCTQPGGATSRNRHHTTHRHTHTAAACAAQTSDNPIALTSARKLPSMCLCVRQKHNHGQQLVTPAASAARKYTTTLYTPACSRLHAAGWQMTCSRLLPWARTVSIDTNRRQQPNLM